MQFLREENTIARSETLKSLKEKYPAETEESLVAQHLSKPNVFTPVFELQDDAVDVLSMTLEIIEPYVLSAQKQADLASLESETTQQETSFKNKARNKKRAARKKKKRAEQ